MVRLAWRMLRQRPASLAATFVALWFAVAVVTACGAMLESGVRYHGTVVRYAAAPVLVAETTVTTSSGVGQDRNTEGEPLAERGQLDTSIVDRIAAVPGVRAAIGDLAVPAQIATPGGAVPVEVHPWSAAQLTPFALRTGAAPGAFGDVVLGDRLALRVGAHTGETVRVVLPTGVQTFTVTGIAASTASSPDTTTVFATDTEVHALSPRPNAVDVVGVLPAQGVATQALAASVRAVLGPPVPDGSSPAVYTGAARGGVESLAVGNARAMVVALSSVFGGITLLIATLVIAGTVSLSIRLRHRDVALLRAIAATPRQVRRMVIVESAVVGIVAAGAGIWPGLGIAAWLRGQFVSRGMVPDSFHTHLSWLPPLVAASAALLVAIVAAWIAGLRTSRVRPTEALGETAVERRGIGIVRAFAGLVALGGGITLSVVSESASGDSAASISVGTVATLVTAIGLLAPLLIRAAAATFGRALHAFGVSGRLAAATTATSAYRLSAVVTSMVLAVALGGSLWFVETSTEHAASRQVRAGLTADYVITGNAGGVTPSVVTAMRQTDGVVAATGVVRSTVFTSNDLSDYAAQGIDAGTSSRVLDLGVVAGSLANLHGNSVAIDKLTAGSLHLGVGDQFTGWFGDGAPARLRVVALYTRGLGFAAFTLPRDVLAPHVSSGFDDAVFVAVGADRASTARVLRREVAALAPGSTLLPRDAYQVGLDANLVENAWANQTVTAVLVVYVAIAAVNTLVMYALGRRREFAVLRLSGTTRRQLFAVVRLEQTLLLGIALVIGVAIAAATLLPMVKGITGSATPYIPATGWVTVFGGTILLSLVGTLVPVRRALRMRPVEAIGIRE